MSDFKFTGKNVIVVPHFCLCCGSRWHGGFEEQGRQLPVDKPIFYECGASLRMLDTVDVDGNLEHHLIFKGCKNEDKE